MSGGRVLLWGAVIGVLFAWTPFRHVVSEMIGLAFVLVKIAFFGLIVGWALAAFCEWLKSPAGTPAEAAQVAAGTGTPAAQGPALIDAPSRTAETQTRASIDAAAAGETVGRCLRVTVLPPRTSADEAETAQDGRGQLMIIGPGLGKLADRLDPLTRTSFAHGEHVVRCGGCGRLYKIGTCRALEYRCPVDRASLRVRKP